MSAPMSPRWRSWAPARRCASWLLCMALATHAMAFDVEKAKQSVPRIVLLIDSTHAETGSGFVVHAEDDYCIVATNYHVVQKRTDDTPLYVLRKVPDGVDSHKAEVILQDDQRD